MDVEARERCRHRRRVAQDLQAPLCDPLFHHRRLRSRSVRIAGDGQSLFVGAHDPHVRFGVGLIGDFDPAVGDPQAEAHRGRIAALRVFGARQGALNLRDLASADLIIRMVQYPERRPDLKSLTETGSNQINMTYLALNLSRYVNGVAKKHGEVSRLMFGGYEIDAITNGVHAVTWTSPQFQQL